MSDDIRKIDHEMDFKIQCEEGMDWYSVDDPPLVLDGLYWRKVGGEFRRVPAGYSISPNIDQTLAFHTAGAMLRFVSDADEIRVAVKLHKNARMDHMAATGSMGFDQIGRASCRERVCHCV